MRKHAQYTKIVYKSKTCLNKELLISLHFVSNLKLG